MRLFVFHLFSFLFFVIQNSTKQSRCSFKRKFLVFVSNGILEQRTLFGLVELVASNKCDEMK
jgi:hypothetical protein